MILLTATPLFRLASYMWMPSAFNPSMGVMFLASVKP